MKILFIGDIVSEVGRTLLSRLLKSMVHRNNIDFVIANGENAAHGKGINASTYHQIKEAGVDAITMGNHFITKMEPLSFYEGAASLVRPYNISPQAPGIGSRVFDVKGTKVRVTNLLGRVFMPDLQPSNPFDALETIIKNSKEMIHIVDFHAETTGEKYSFGWAFDGYVSAILGTHTHIQTADNRILPSGTAFISDVGMTGPYYSVIGAKKEEVIFRTRTGLPAKFDVAPGEGVFSAVILDIDEITGKARSIERIYLTPDKVPL